MSVFGLSCIASRTMRMGLVLDVPSHQLPSPQRSTLSLHNHSQSHDRVTSHPRSSVSPSPGLWRGRWNRLGSATAHCKPGFQVSYSASFRFSWRGAEGGVGLGVHTMSSWPETVSVCRLQHLDRRARVSLLRRWWRWRGRVGVG